MSLNVSLALKDILDMQLKASLKLGKICHWRGAPHLSTSTYHSPSYLQDLQGWQGGFEPTAGPKIGGELTY